MYTSGKYDVNVEFSLKSTKSGSFEPKETPFEDLIKEVKQAIKIYQEPIEIRWQIQKYSFC
jgi:hypothetical protein